MIRNFVVGVAWGGVVAGLGLVVISQVAPMQGVPEAAIPVAEPVIVAPKPAEVVAKPAPEPGLKPVAPAEIAAPAPLTPAQPEAAANAALPQPDATAAAVAAPQAAPPLDAPLPQDTAVAAAAPTAQAPKVQLEEPAAIATPDAATPDAATPDSPPPGDAAALPADDTALITADAQPLPAAPGGDLAPAAAELPPPAAPQTDEPLLDPPAAPAAAPDPVSIAPQPIADPEPVDPPAPVAPPAPLETPAKPPSEITSLLPSTIAPDTGLNEPVAGVTTGRLPSIAAAAPNPEVTAAPAPASAPGSEAEATTPLSRYARSFANPTNKPLFAIVLLDTGAADLNRAQLAALPFPVSFVIDPLNPDAAQAAAIYRGAGQEVLMLATGIPAGATASDLEQTFQAHADALPEAVAILDLAEGGFQNDRPLATQVVPILKAQGRGLLTYDKGLNAADQVARREDLPAATIFRSLDAEGEETALIRRYLDRAAFKAAQDGRVVVLGQTRPETIAALLEWTVEGRAAAVALAPASAVVSLP